MTDVRPYRERSRPELPAERFIDTYELRGILHEHQITALNKSNPAHQASAPTTRSPSRGDPARLINGGSPTCIATSMCCGRAARRASEEQRDQASHRAIH